MGCILGKLDTDEAECSRKVVSGRRVASDIRPQVNVRDLQLEWARVLHEILLILVLIYGSDTILCSEKERSRIRAVQMDNLRSFLGIKRIDRVPNARIRDLCGVTKGLDEKSDEDVLRWFGHM